jgi:hypothetical protein
MHRTQILGQEALRATKSNPEVSRSVGGGKLMEKASKAVGNDVGRTAQ